MSEALAQAERRVAVVGQTRATLRGMKVSAQPAVEASCHIQRTRQGARYCALSALSASAQAMPLRVVELILYSLAMRFADTYRGRRYKEPLT